jgi:hypothetical protein
MKNKKKSWTTTSKYILGMKMILFDYNQFTLNKTELEKHASKTLVRFNNRIKNYILDLDFLYAPILGSFIWEKLSSSLQ